MRPIAKPKGARSILEAMLSGVALSLPAAWFAGEIAVRWRRRPRHFSPTASARDVTLRAADGMALAATYWPGARPDAPAALLIHGVYDSRADLAPHAEWLADQGFAVMAIDLRGHGASGRALHAFGLTESRDARAAFDWLSAQQRGAPIGILGVSLGGAATLLGDDGPLPCAALVLQAVYPDIRRATRNRIATFLSPPLGLLLEPLLSWQSLPRYGARPDRLTPIKALAGFHGPVLVVGGGADRFTPPGETREIFEAVRGPKELLMLEGLDHEAASHAWTDDYRQALLRFFRSTLGAP